MERLIFGMAWDAGWVPIRKRGPEAILISILELMQHRYANCLLRMIDELICCFHSEPSNGVFGALQPMRLGTEMTSEKHG